MALIFKRVNTLIICLVKASRAFDGVTHAKDVLCTLLADSPSSILAGFSAAGAVTGRFANTVLRKVINV